VNIEVLAKSQVVDSSLWRPDWAVGTGRSTEKIWLDKNENFDPELSRVVMSIYHSIGVDAVYGYPDLSSLYKKLALFLDVKVSNLLLSHGSDGVIRSMFEVFVSSGDRVLITSPTFIMYELYSKMYGAEIVKVDYQPTERGPLLKLEWLVRAIEKNRPKLVCIPNPDSPTGTVFDADELEELISVCNKNDAIVLIDEAYFSFCDITALPLIEKNQNLVVARTFAKAWGMAGLRIGYAVGAEKIISLLHKVRPMYEINSVAAAVAEEMLNKEHEVLKSVQRMKDGADYFMDKMSDIGFKTISGEGNFFHISFGDKLEYIDNKINKNVLYRKSFEHKSLFGYSRFSSAPIDTMRSVVNSIANA